MYVLCSTLSVCLIIFCVPFLFSHYRLVFLILFLCFCSCFLCLFSILCILCFCIVLYIISPFVYSYLFPIFVQVYRPLPPGGNPIAVNKYHISIQHVVSGLITARHLNLHKKIFPLAERLLHLLVLTVVLTVETSVTHSK
jgi:hypothetical protein